MVSFMIFTAPVWNILDSPSYLPKENRLITDFCFCYDPLILDPLQMGQSILEFKHTKPISAILIEYTMHVADGKHDTGSVTLSTSQTPQ
jgi:hypothetical protein